jgi:F-type H+-transporting ATPase subunit a
MRNSFKLSKFGLVIITLLLSVITLRASAAGDDSLKEEFNAGKMIIDHISDDYSWHILDWKEHSVSIPLPVILFDIDSSKLHVFSSANFHHGHDSYQGFKISDESGIVPFYNGTMEVDPNRSKPLDFSITKNVFAVMISAIIILLIFLNIAKSYKNRGLQAPKGLQSLLEPVILFIRDDVAKSSIGRKYERFMPFLLTIFFFILINNLMGLIPIFPGGANVTGNIAVTLVLAAFTLITITINGNKAYWKHIFNAPGVPWWLKIPLPLMPIIELSGVFIKPFVLMVRLFANILAGHIVVLGFFSLIFIFGAIDNVAGYGSTILALPFALFISMLEILVAFIQAYVFTLLSAIYLGMAVEESH